MLSNKTGPVEKAHEHDWLLEIKLKGDKLSETGCLIDFQDIDRKIDKVIAPLENRNLAELNFLKDKSASTEVIAKYLFFKIKDIIEGNGILLIEATVWEDDNHGASFGL